MEKFSISTNFQFLQLSCETVSCESCERIEYWLNVTILNVSFTLVSNKLRICIFHD